MLGDTRWRNRRKSYGWQRFILYLYSKKCVVYLVLDALRLLDVSGSQQLGQYCKWIRSCQVKSISCNVKCSFVTRNPNLLNKLCLKAHKNSILTIDFRSPRQGYFQFNICPSSRPMSNPSQSSFCTPSIAYRRIGSFHQLKDNPQ